MQQYPFLAVCAVSALVPLVVGFIWYHKAVFGNTWMRINRFTEADMRGGNMALTFVLTYVFSFMLSIALSAIVVHQFSLLSVVGGQAKTGADKVWLESALAVYGDKFRTFKHGAFHGTIMSVFLALPVIGIIALFERRGWKYIVIHWGYWVVTLALMGGLLCQFIKLNAG